MTRQEKGLPTTCRSYSKVSIQIEEGLTLFSNWLLLSSEIRAESTLECGNHGGRRDGARTDVQKGVSKTTTAHLTTANLSTKQLTLHKKAAHTQCHGVFSWDTVTRILCYLELCRP